MTTDSQLQNHNYKLLCACAVPPDDGQWIRPKHVEVSYLNIIIIIIQPKGQIGQEPENNHSTGMALVRCILDKFLGWFAIAIPRV
jgi:hypothetical protein